MKLTKILLILLGIVLATSRRRRINPAILPSEENSAEKTIQKLNILVRTFNMGAKIKNFEGIDIEELKTNFGSTEAHVVIFGFQEIIELRLVNLLNPESNTLQKFRKKFIETFQSVLGEKYNLVSSCNLVGIMQLVFIHSDINEKHYKVMEVTNQKFGFHNKFGNKGACLASLTLYGKSVSISTCHLDHSDNEKRKKKLVRILDFTFKDSSIKAFKDHDYSFILGDLNFRLDLAGDNKKEELKNIFKLFENSQYNEDAIQYFREQDQLNAFKNENSSFSKSGFLEGKITFNPTYKFETANDKTKYTRRRIPAWCDRILYNPGDGKLQLKNYGSQDYQLSDHRPVYAAFTFTIADDYKNTQLG